MKKVIFITMLAVCSLSMQAQFSGQGSGTEKDPYQITNADQLFEVRNDLTAYYKVMNDIDLGIWINEENPKQGWASIGTDSNPFMGVFDGNNKTIKGLYINRPNMNSQGFFGYVKSAIVKNICLLNPLVTGNNNVGPIVGTSYNENGNPSDISNNVVIGGIVTGENNVGGIMGLATAPSVASYIITGNFSSAKVQGTSYIGGISGYVKSRYSWGDYVNAQVLYNVFYGDVVGTNYVGGILGSLNNEDYGTTYSSIMGNLFGGTIKGSGQTHGLAGQITGIDVAKKISKNVCCADTISSGDIPYRFSNVAGVDNYSYAGTIVLTNNKTINVEDDEYNGTSMGLNSLRRKNTYIGLGYDFATQWDIVEGQSFPYKFGQSAPCKVSSFASGSRGKITGTAEKNGIVYVFIGKNLYESYVVDGQWEVVLPNTSVGTEARVVVSTNGMMPSLFVKAIAEKSHVVPDKTTADANGDGVVDSADVTAIINYILGKPSASFNMDNADVTGDGEILIDDAVQTVQMIMDAQ